MAETAPAVDATQSGRPQKPDEAKFKADLATAEKAHDAAQKRFVRVSHRSIVQY